MIAGSENPSSKQPMIIGRVMHFILADDTTTNFSEVNEEQVSTANQTARCFGNWYVMKVDGRLNQINVDENFYCVVSSYQCTLPKPDLELVGEEIITRFASAAADALKVKMGTMTRKDRAKKCGKKQKSSKKVNRVTNKKKSRYDNLSESSTDSDSSDESFELDDSTDTEMFTTDSELQESEQESFVGYRKSDVRQDKESAEESAENIEINKTYNETEDPSEDPLMTKVSSPNDIHENDFVIVQFTYNANTKKKCTKDFVSKILCMKKKKITVSCMRLHKGKRDAFVFPDVEDKTNIDFAQIKLRLCNPQENRGIFTFPANVL